MGVEIKHMDDDTRVHLEALHTKLDVARCRGLLRISLHSRGVGSDGDFDKYQRAGKLSLEESCKDKLLHAEGDFLDDVMINRSLSVILSDETKSQAFRTLKIAALLQSQWSPMTMYNRARTFEAVFGESEITLAGHAHQENIELLREITCKLNAYLYMIGRDRLTHMKQHFNVANTTDPLKDGDLISDLKGLAAPIYVADANKGDKSSTSKPDLQYEQLLESGNILSIWRSLNKLPPQRVYRLVSNALPRLSDARLFIFSRLIHFLVTDTITRSHRVTLKLLTAVEDLNGVLTLPVESWQMLEELRIGLCRHYPRVFSMMRLRGSWSGIQTSQSTKMALGHQDFLGDNPYHTPRFGKKHVAKNSSQKTLEIAQEQREENAGFSRSVGRLIQMVAENDLPAANTAMPEDPIQSIKPSIFVPKKLMERSVRRSAHYDPSSYEAS